MSFLYRASYLFPAALSLLIVASSASLGMAQSETEDRSAKKEALADLWPKALEKIESLFDSLASKKPKKAAASPVQSDRAAQDYGDDLIDFDVEWTVRHPRAAAPRPSAIMVSDRAADAGDSSGTETDREVDDDELAEDSDQDQDSDDEISGSAAEDATPVIVERASAATVGYRGRQARSLDVYQNMSTVIETSTRIERAEVSDAEIIEVFVASPKRLIVTGKSFGATQLVVWSEGEAQVFDITVERNLRRLDKLIRSVSSTADVRVSSVNGTIILTGRVPDAGTAEQIEEVATLFQGGEVGNQLQVAGVHQIMLEVVFAEVNKEATRRLGINWGFGGSPISRDFFLANNLGLLNPTVFASSGVADLITGQQIFSLAPNANGAGSNFTFGFPRAELQMFLNALREDGLARTLAEPTLIATAGQTASFLAGGEVPIPVTQGGATAGAITIDYKEFGIRLAFTPVLMGRQIIRLHVMAEMSSLRPTTQFAGGIPLFTFDQRRVESTVECGNGESFAIAGLLNEEVEGIASKIPGLGDIPVLGTLFSSVEYQKSTTELLIMVTPRLVEPIGERQAPPLPGTLITDPNDFELFMQQKLQGQPKPRPEPLLAARTESDPGIVGHTAALPNGGLLELQGPWGIAESE